MNKWTKIAVVIGAVLMVSVLALGAAGAAAFAQTGSPFEGRSDFFSGPDHHRGGPGGGVQGEVTAVNDNSLTVENRQGESVTVLVSDETRVMLAESQSEGSLADVTVGSNVGVKGRPNDNGDIEARGLVVLPAGDMAGGRVTALDGASITVENREGETATIVTDDETTFRLNRDETGSLADVTVDEFVGAFGETQDDGSLAARLVMIGRPGPRDGERGPGKRGGERGPGGNAGEVSAIDGNSFTLTPFLDEAPVTVQTDENTEYRTRGGDSLSFDDIDVGDTVMVRGAPVDGQEDTVLARVIGIKQ